MLATLLVWGSLLATGLAWTGGERKEASPPQPTASLTQWLSLRIYSALAGLIIVCLVYTLIRNKYYGKQTESEWVRWLDALWKVSGCNSISCTTPSTFRRMGVGGMLGSPLGPDGVMLSPDTPLEDKLKDVETELYALKSELDLAHKSKLELENSLELLDKDKMTIEEQLESEKVHSAIEVEKLKMETLITNRELQRVLSEKEELDREVESLQRDASIAEKALRDQRSLQCRLDQAKLEIHSLRRQMEVLQREKESAVAMVSDIMDKAGKRGLPGDLRPTIPLSLYEGGECETVQDSSQLEDKSDLSSCEGGEPAWTTGPYLHDEEPGFVTGSPFFRKFLQNNFVLSTEQEEIDT